MKRFCFESILPQAYSKFAKKILAFKSCRESKQPSPGYRLKALYDHETKTFDQRWKKKNVISVLYFSLTFCTSPLFIKVKLLKQFTILIHKKKKKKKKKKKNYTIKFEYVKN